MLDVVAPNRFRLCNYLLTYLREKIVSKEIRNYPTRKLCLCLDYKFIRAYVAIWKFSNFL